jgi:hypothetical protein
MCVPYLDNDVQSCCAAVAGFLLNAFMAALQLLPRVYEATFGTFIKINTAAWMQRPFHELLLSALWSIMWLAGAAAVSHLLEGSAECAGACCCSTCSTLHARAFACMQGVDFCATPCLLRSLAQYVPDGFWSNHRRSWLPKHLQRQGGVAAAQAMHDNGGTGAQ